VNPDAPRPDEGLLVDAVRIDRRRSRVPTATPDGFAYIVCVT
jgi:hypothetical protein